jgi:hypothetical protein
MTGHQREHTRGYIHFIPFATHHIIIGFKGHSTLNGGAYDVWVIQKSVLVQAASSCRHGLGDAALV